MNGKRKLTTLGLLMAMAAGLAGMAAHAAGERIQIRNDQGRGELAVRIDGKPALVYKYGEAVDIPHYYPLYSPSGKVMNIEKTEPFPHHRAFYFADTVKLASQARQVSFYGAYYTRLKKDDPASPFKDHIRNVGFLPEKIEGDRAEFGMKQLWEMDQRVPVLDQESRVKLVALGQGEYLLDLTYIVTATYGDVTFLSDKVHYAWPFVRLTPEFTPAKGGTLTNSVGGVGQKLTDQQPALWVDYSNTVEGKTEGLTLFANPEIKEPQRWLTRDYGTCGVRRTDDKSGKPFTLKKGESLTQHVGVLVHNGDVKGGKVAERYQRFAAGKM